MLFDENAIQSLLNDAVRDAIRGKTIINTSSISADYSQYVDRYVRDAGGEFIEMPVSGSTIPAKQGRLVGMMAGDRGSAERVRPLVEPLTAAAVYCGLIGSGLRMKYAINLFLVTMTAGLAESFNLAKAQGLDPEAFGKVLEAGPMSSDYSKIKVTKMLKDDWSPQAAIKDCYNSTLLIQSAVEAAQTQAPLANLCRSMYGRANKIGLGEEDMIGVVKLLSQSRETDQ